MTANSSLRIALAAGVLSLMACRAADIPTAQYDNSRTLWNGSETRLNTSNISSATFGKIFTKALDGWVYAQPLYLENMAIPGRGTINVVYVATMHNTVYAMDADNPSAAVIWSASLGAPDTSIGYLGPEWGILSTPVIVREKQALYAVATNFENGHRVFRLHALDLVTGAEKFGGPVVVSGQTPGTAMDSKNGVLAFDPDQHRQRISLAVASNSVYIIMAGLNLRPFHGWVFGYDTSTLQQTGVYCDTPNGQVGGIWQSGRAPAVDANGALYFETGDGDFNGVTNFGDTLVKLSTTGTVGVADWFAPYNWSALFQYDWDLGSSGPLLIPGVNRIIAGSKAGVLYVVDPTNLGQTSPGNGQIVQSFQAAPACTSTQNDSCGEIHGQAFWNHVTKPTLYVWAWRDTLKAYPFSNGQLDTAHTTNGTMTANYPGGQLAVSSDGSTPGTGIVWAITSDPPDYSNAGELRAFDATDVTRELWNSGQNSARDGLPTFARFVSPVVANGKVYVATFSNQLVVYGLLPALSVSKSHNNSFAQGQQNATYAVTVSNASGVAATSGTVTMAETAPSGLTLVSMSGTGWACGSITCTRSDALTGGSSYPPITVTVNVAANATSPQVNQVSASGGGSATANASDSTTLIAAFTGSVDQADCNTIAGWAADRTRLNQSINVDIYDGTTLIATVAANVNRPDVGSFLGDNGNHGFSLAVPASLKDGNTHSITVKFAGTATVVRNSPRSLSCSAAAQYGGSFDLADCNQIAGWAADSTRLNQSINVDIYEGATLIATVAANQSRPDVGSFLHDNGNHGFSLPTPSSLKDGNPHSITVKFAGTAIVVSNSPRPLSCSATAQYGGSFDLADCNNLAGWAADSNRLNQSINVDIYDGATLIATVAANQSRPDVGSYLHDNGNHGFSLPTPASLKDGNPHSITVKFAGTATVVSNSPRSLSCSAGAQYGGSFDIADCNQIAGWAADSNRLNQSINVDFYDGATLIGTVLASQNRPDVGSFLGDNGNHGFNIATPSSLKTGTAHSVGVKFGGTATSLSNSPKSLTCP